MHRRIGLLLALVVALGACQDMEQPLAPEAAFDIDHHHPPGDGTHLRGGNLTWRATGPTTAEFTYTVFFRRTFFVPLPNLGDVRQFASVSFGDGGGVAPNFTVTHVDAAEDWFEARAVFSHTYAGVGPYTALNQICCRLSPGPARFPWDLRNNGDEVYRIQTRVAFASAGAPTTGLPPVITCPLEGDCLFNVPATPRAGQNVRWRMASGPEMNGTNPGPPQATHAATVDPNTGLYSWNTRGASAPNWGAGWKTVYSTQVALESLDGNGNVVAKSAVDFLIYLADIEVNAPPAFDVPPSPADGSSYTVNVGQTLTLNIQASDSDAGDVVSMSALGLPGGASFPAPTPANPVSSTFSWTPAPGQDGDYVVNFLAVDDRGLNAAPLSISITVPSNQPPVADAGPDQVTGSALACTVGGTLVALDGSGSTDPDDNIVSYDWYDGDGNLVATGETATVTLALGTHTLTLEVTDDGGLSDQDQVQIEIVDNAPPTVTLTSGIDELWSPNHKYHTIAVSASAVDGCTPSAGLILSGTVESNEPDDAKGNGDGNTTGDVRVTQPDGTVLLSSNATPAVAFDPLTDTLELRAERAGKGSGRVYTITFTVDDGNGNQTTLTAEVSVPHNQGGG